MQQIVVGQGVEVLLPSRLAGAWDHVVGQGQPECVQRFAAANVPDKHSDIWTVRAMPRVV